MNTKNMFLSIGLLALPVLVAGCSHDGVVDTEVVDDAPAVVNTVTAPVAAVEVAAEEVVADDVVEDVATAVAIGSADEVTDVVAEDPDTDIPEDWLTYTDSVNGFSLEYPSEFSVDEGIGDSPNSKVTFRDAAGNSAMVFLATNYDAAPQTVLDGAVLSKERLEGIKDNIDSSVNAVSASGIEMQANIIRSYGYNGDIRFFSGNDYVKIDLHFSTIDEEHWYQFDPKEIATNEFEQLYQDGALSDAAEAEFLLYKRIIASIIVL